MTNMSNLSYCDLWLSLTGGKKEIGNLARWTTVGIERSRSWQNYVDHQQMSKQKNEEVIGDLAGQIKTNLKLQRGPTYSWNV